MTKTVGNTVVFPNISAVVNRRAVPHTMMEAGAIQSISIYHQGGTGHAILAAYADASGRPGAQLGVTDSTLINSSEGYPPAYQARVPQRQLRRGLQAIGSESDFTSGCGTDLFLLSCSRISSSGHGLRLFRVLTGAFEIPRTLGEFDEESVSFMQESRPMNVYEDTRIR